MIRPSAVTTVSASTFSRIVPYRTAFVPEARVAAMPPIDASAPGSIGKKRPVCRISSLSAFRVTPACTVASRSSACTASTLFIWLMSMHTPPWIASTWPSSDVPTPYGMIGV